MTAVAIRGGHGTSGGKDSSVRRCGGWSDGRYHVGVSPNPQVEVELSDIDPKRIQFLANLQHRWSDGLSHLRRVDVVSRVPQHCIRGPVILDAACMCSSRNQLRHVGGSRELFELLSTGHATRGLWNVSTCRQELKKHRQRSDPDRVRRLPLPVTRQRRWVVLT